VTRKLVTVRPVKDILPIAGADKIELAIIDGWQVVVMKGRHTPGELVLYYEIDSFLPDTDPRYATFEERFSNWGEKRGMRLKTIKLRKQLSQGLVMPLDEFPEVKDYMANMDRNAWEGLDVSELLGIEKWEPIEKEWRGNSPGSSEGKRFPAFVRKTDQERIQNYGTLVARALDEDFEVTVKKDGSSLTVFRVDPKSPYYNDAKALARKKLTWLQRIGQFLLNTFERKQAVYGICSRNVMLPLNGDSNFHKAADSFGLAEVLDIMGGSYALQGELVAPDIQGNYEKVNCIEFHLFDIFDIDKQEYVLPLVRQEIAGDVYMPHCSVLKMGKLRDILGITPEEEADADIAGIVVKKALAFAEGPGDNEGVMREGVVFKALKRDFSFKVVSNSYLLAQEKSGK
jgi:RNA ligase (TIGR02306 family)